jgi:NAD(P)-dependent dehydrogenase (short-subunit alcohol dehydrogenase family)
MSTTAPRPTDQHTAAASAAAPAAHPRAACPHPADRYRVSGARALVTGASRGIGRAVALALADAGADLALAARTTAALESSVAAVEERGRKAFPVAGDLAVPGMAAEVVELAAAALGGLDIVVHNAGILPSDGGPVPILAPFQETRQRHWVQVVSVNLNATAELCRTAHPHLADSD